MTTNEKTFEITLLDNVSQRYLQAKSIPQCGVGKLIMVKNDDPDRNDSKLKIYTRKDTYFDRDITCC